MSTAENLLNNDVLYFKSGCETWKSNTDANRKIYLERNSPNFLYPRVGAIRLMRPVCAASLQKKIYNCEETHLTRASPSRNCITIIFHATKNVEEWSSDWFAHVGCVITDAYIRREYWEIFKSALNSTSFLSIDSFDSVPGFFFSSRLSRIRTIFFPRVSHVLYSLIAWRQLRVMCSGQRHFSFKCVCVHKY